MDPYTHCDNTVIGGDLNGMVSDGILPTLSFLTNELQSFP